MSFKENFCPSPWVHMRINNSGTYKYCRWIDLTVPSVTESTHNIQNESPLNFFQQGMASIRKSMLDGESTESCRACDLMDRAGKVSGRQRQLLKIGVLEDHYERSLASSPLRADFDYSQTHNGHTLRTVSDWQIDLGNYCNSACVMCNPESSSRLAAEFKKLGIIEQVPPPAWCDDPELLDRFIQDLKQCEQLKYLHFIGGETVITPGFKSILSALIDSGLADQVSIGFTTNLTVWSEEVNQLLVQFREVNLGMSIESLNCVNDYVRYPSQLDQTLQLLDRWVSLGRDQSWLMQLRITPTCLTVHDISTVYEYAWENNIAVESCNFLYKPDFLRIAVLPKEQRDWAKDRLSTWLKQHQVNSSTRVINTRDPNRVYEQIYQDAESYLFYLDTAEDESFRLPDLVAYLKQLESNRNNTILDYLPEYEDLFRSAGY